MVANLFLFRSAYPINALGLCTVVFVLLSSSQSNSKSSYYTCGATVVEPICVSGYPFTLQECKNEDIVYPVGSRVDIQDTYVVHQVRMFSFFRGMDASAAHYRLDKGCDVSKIRCELQSYDRKDGQSCR
jgi:hypothetical protein